MNRAPFARRTFLRGLGAAVALPMLDAMVPSRALASAAAAAPTRMAFVFFPNGAIMPSWTPQGIGVNGNFRQPWPL